MSSARRPIGRRPAPGEFLDCLRHFLTPAAWKQGGAALGGRRAAPRWRLQPLIEVALLMTWGAGDTWAERFEPARAFYSAMHDKRRRPGKTVQGFSHALSQLPMHAFRAVAKSVRARVAEAVADGWVMGGFVPFGCDGTRLECARTAELERWLSPGDAADSAPMLALTAMVHLPTGVPWSWRVGRAPADERADLIRLIPTLPADALVVADAGFVGYELMRAILAAGASFLIRMSSKDRLLADCAEPPDVQGLVWYWPMRAQQRGAPAVRARLIRVRGRKADVWLLTDVLSEKRLTVAAASRFYRLRWRNEGFFRTFKRTLKKTKLTGRTVRVVRREAETAVLGAQLLLAWGMAALAPAGREATAACSPAAVLREVRREIAAVAGPMLLRPGRGGFAARLGGCAADRRPGRRSSQVRRQWPRRKTHQPPGRPMILKVTAKQRALMKRTRTAA